MKASDFFLLEAKQSSWAHAYLLIGKNERKTEELINYIIAEKKCHKTDISIVAPEDASGKKGEIKIEQIKNLLHDISLSPSGDNRIGIIYHAERLNQSSGNMLLKTIEEPPSSVTFILVAEASSVLATIKSRCRIVSVPAELELTEDPVKEKKFTEILTKGFAGASKQIETIVKNNEIESFLDHLEDYFRKAMLRTKSPKDAEAIRKIEKARKDLAGNVNPRLALEALFLQISSRCFFTS